MLTALLLLPATDLRTEPRELPAPAWVFGVVTFVILLAALLVTLGFGKGRHHV